MFNCRSTTKNSVSSKARRYSSEEIDFFATYWNNKAYLVPISQCSTQKTLHLEPTESARCCYIENFAAEEVLKEL